MDLWKSGQGGDATVSVITEGGTTVKAPTLDNKEAWQPVSLTFESDGDASTTIQLAAIHTSAGSEKIIGFDNVTIQLDPSTSIQAIKGKGSHPEAPLYDLSGRRLNTKQPQKGIYIKGNRKIAF